MNRIMHSRCRSRLPIQIEILRGLSRASRESQHLVDAVVVDARGSLIESYGDPTTPIYPRSVIKPIQALPFVLSGAHLRAPDSTKAIAISCASHASEHEHLAFLKMWHEALGINPEEALACGPQKPDDERVFFEIIRAHRRPQRVHNNCSGKHTGMIATALVLGLDPRGYAQYAHPIQVEIRQHLTDHSGLDHARQPWGIDGCGIPTYLIPQINIAKMMSVMHSDVNGIKEIRTACAREPYMVGGHGWLCSEIGAATNGRIFAKVGAEGNYAAVIYDQGKTIVMKSRDGSFRASEAALLSLLDVHGALQNEEREKIRSFASGVLTNWAGTVVGQIQVQMPPSS